MSAATTISTSGPGLIGRPAPGEAGSLERVRRGQERSFETLYKRHHGQLLSYCRHILGNREEAEDALQQTFIKAHRAMSDGNPPRELRPWLYAVARNCCLSAIAARKPTSELDDRTASLAGLPEQVSQREDLREMVAGLGRLPEDQRSALLLAELEDLSHEEIASVLECPVSKVKALVYQARSSLIAERDARDTPCQEIREQLSVARGGVLRRGPLRRHLKLCSGCRDFQQAVSVQRQSLAAVLPVLPTAGLAASVLGHVATHAASHATASAGIGGTGASLAPAGAAGTAGVAASSGGGVAGGSIVGGGLATKLAVSGAVAVLATAGAVTAGHRLVHQQRAPSRNSGQLLRHGHGGAAVASPPVTGDLTTPVNYRADSLGKSPGGESTSWPGPTPTATPQTSLSGVSSGATLLSGIPSSPSGAPSNGASPGSGTPVSGPGSTGAPGGPVAGHASQAARRRTQSQLRRARQRRAHLRAAARRRRVLRAAARRRRLQAAARRRRLRAAALRRREAARRRREAALRRRLERIAARKARAPKAKAPARTSPAAVAVGPTLTKSAATPSPTKAPKDPKAKPKKPENAGVEAKSSPEAEAGSTAPAESGSSGSEIEEPAAGTGVEATSEEGTPKPKTPGAKAKGPRAGRVKAPGKATGAGTGVEAAATNAT
jgi:RNA polymerase sigma factor (sigma-70 family)